MGTGIMLRLLGFGATLVQTGCIVHCTLAFGGDIIECTGPSMQPTINHKDIIFSERISVTKHNIERGDIVIAQSPSKPLEHICKRVVLMEGDAITHPNYAHNYIPKGHVWLEGDNHDNSTDSRNYGPIPYALIKSRAFYKIWPVDDRQSLNKKPGYVYTVEQLQQTT